LDFIFAQGQYADRIISNIPKLILLDIKLPKVSGIEVLQKIKSDERTKAIPVIVLTSSQEEKDMVEGYKLGVNSYIIKPIDFDKFTQAVAEIGYYWLVLNQRPK
jgi:two-component system response regulator